MSKYVNVKVGVIALLVLLTLISVGIGLIKFTGNKGVLMSILQPTKKESVGTLVQNFPNITIPEYAAVKNSYSETRGGKKVFAATWTTPSDKTVSEVMEWVEDEYYPTWLVVVPAEENKETQSVKLKKDSTFLTLTVSKSSAEKAVEITAFLENE